MWGEVLGGQITYGLLDHCKNFGFYFEWECQVSSRVTWCDWDWERIPLLLFNRLSGPKMGAGRQVRKLWHQSEWERMLALTGMLASEREREVAELRIICILKAECTRFAGRCHVTLMKESNQGCVHIFRLNNWKKSRDEETMGGLNLGRKIKFGFEYVKFLLNKENRDLKISIYTLEAI